MLERVHTPNLVKVKKYLVFLFYDAYSVQVQLETKLILHTTS